MYPVRYIELTVTLDSGYLPVYCNKVTLFLGTRSHLDTGACVHPCCTGPLGVYIGGVQYRVASRPPTTRTLQYMARRPYLP